MQKQTIDIVFQLQLIIIITLIFLLVMLLYILYKNYNYSNIHTQKNHPHTPTFYFINLDKSINRKQRYEERLSKYPNVHTERIPAITPHDIKKYKIYISPSCKINTELEIACTLSHLKSIFTAYKNLTYNISKNKNTNNYAMITEDDLLILEMPNWSKLVNSAPRDWEILQLVASGPLAEHMYNKNTLEWQPHIHNMWCCAAYLINLKGMITILNSCVPEYKTIDNWNDITIINLDHNNTNCAADHIIYSLANTYTYTNPLFNVEGIDSTIHSHHLPTHLQTIDVINNRFNNYQKESTNNNLIIDSTAIP
jgi:GR25 family glycosyltransferase involved in LPS biosynthesis